MNEIREDAKIAEYETKANNIFSQIVTKIVLNLTKAPEMGRTQRVNEIFDYINLILIEKIGLFLMRKYF